jgi:LacI family transcriptional regulator
MAVDLGDVARAAGVSRATASRALSGHPSVLPETRERVLRVAKELDYHADPVARALRAGSSNLIGLIVTNLQNTAIQEVAETVQAVGQLEGYEVLIATTNDDTERERRLVGALTSRRVDGLLVMSGDENVPRLNKLFHGGLPVVEIIRLPDGTTAPGVVYDDHHAGLLATGHLLDLGHRRIAFLGGPAHTRSGGERYRGYVQAHDDRGVELEADLIHRGPFQSAFGSTTVDALFTAARVPTALVIANHEAMFAALQALNRRGLRAPADLSVVAVEDDPLLAWWHPSVTVVDVRPRDLAVQAMTSLLAQIRKSATDPEGHVATVEAELVLRHSTAPPGTT